MSSLNTELCTLSVGSAYGDGVFFGTRGCVRWELLGNGYKPAQIVGLTPRKSQLSEVHTQNPTIRLTFCLECAIIVATTRELPNSREFCRKNENQLHVRTKSRQRLDTHRGCRFSTFFTNSL